MPDRDILHRNQKAHVAGNGQAIPGLTGDVDDAYGRGEVPALLSPEYHADPYPTLAALLKRGPIIDRGEDEGYLVLSHAALSALGRSPHISAVYRPDKELPGLAPRARQLLERVSKSFVKLAEYNMAQSDPPRHTRLRGQATRSFTTRLMKPMRARIQAVANDLLDAAADKGEMDLIRDYAYDLPSIIIMDLLGIPEEDRERLHEWTTDLAGAIGNLHSEAPDSVGFRALVGVTAIFHYSNTLIKKKSRDPRNDYMSELIKAQQAEDGRVTPLEVMGQSGLLLFAAHETVTNLIANGVLALLNHPEELAKLRADPGLAVSAVHEILRYDSPTLSFPRWATADLEVPVGGGVTIPAGAKMQMAYGAANRDPEHYEEPERFDITRGATDYMSFGFDRHMCLGRHLALIEGEIAIGTLIERFPTLRLADGAKLEYQRSLSLRALTALPLVF